MRHNDYSHNTLGDLPVELILKICCHLDPDSIDAVGRLSRSHHALVNDETLWRVAFLERFPTDKGFSPVGSSWRSEYTLRSSLTRKFASGRGKHVFFDARIGLVTHMYTDAQTNEAICGNMTNGLGSVIADKLSGKVKKESIFPSAGRTLSSDITAMAVTKHGLIYGFRNGLVATSSSSKGAKLFKHTVYRGRHAGYVSALGLSESAANSRVTMASGGSDGTLRLWDHRDPHKECLVECSLSALAIEQIVVDATNIRVLALTAASLFCVQWVKSDTQKSNLAVRVTETSLEQGPHLMVYDRRACSIIISAGKYLTKYEMHQGNFLGRDFKSGLHGDILHLSIDPTEQLSDPSLPGSGGRLIACADTEHVLVYNCRKSTSQPVCRIPWPYESISCLAISALVVAVGTIHGQVRAYENITAEPLRMLNGNGGEDSRTVRDQSILSPVSNIFLDPHRPAGTMSVGGYLKSFDLDPQSECINGKKKSSDRRARGGKTVGLNNKLAHLTIREDMTELMQEKKRSDDEKARLERLAGSGDLSLYLNDAEIISYTEMLSRDEVKRKSTDHELAEVLRRSLADQGQSSRSEGLSMDSSGYDDAELAMALSMSEAIQ